MTTAGARSWSWRSAMSSCSAWCQSPSLRRSGPSERRQSTRWSPWCVACRSASRRAARPVVVRVGARVGVLRAARREVVAVDGRVGAGGREPGALAHPSRCADARGVSVFATCVARAADGGRPRARAVLRRCGGEPTARSPRSPPPASGSRSARCTAKVSPQPPSSRTEPGRRRRAARRAPRAGRCAPSRTRSSRRAASPCSPGCAGCSRRPAPRRPSRPSRPR